ADKLTVELLPEALNVAREISDESARASALSSLADRQPELLPEALNVAREISDEYARARALSSLADKLTVELLPEALNVAREISDESARASALSSLAKPLNKTLRLTARKLSLEIQDPYHRAEALGGFLEVDSPLWQDLEKQAKNLLRLLTPEERQYFTGNIPKLYPHLQCLGGQPAVDATLQAMRDACQQWP
ncbi:MAG: hypothetical protein AAF685_10330, partial [Cyanobacteria bacterium P01_C01_bin.89]